MSVWVHLDRSTYLGYGHLCFLGFDAVLCEAVEMNFDFLHKIPWFRSDSNSTPVSNFGSTTILVEQSQEKSTFDFKLWGWSLSFLSIAPWATQKDRVQGRPSAINKKLKRRVHSREVVVHSGSNSSGLRFRPYVSKVPWHTGPRALLSDLFPRYGHYCGPNWSSGKNGGSPIWDQRPIDWLDYCCYCHDIGYDTHDQGKLLEADLAFLDCLERPHASNRKGDLRVAHIYKTMYVAGLKNILIPYRMQLLKMMSKQPLVDFGWLGNMRWKSWKSPKA